MVALPERKTTFIPPIPEACSHRPSYLPAQLTSPGLGTFPAARGAGGGGAGVVDISVFSGVVFTMSEPNPVSTPGTFMSYMLTLFCPRISPPSTGRSPELARDRGDRI